MPFEGEGAAWRSVALCAWAVPVRRNHSQECHRQPPGRLGVGGTGHRLIPDNKDPPRQDQGGALGPSANKTVSEALGLVKRPGGTSELWPRLSRSPVVGVSFGSSEPRFPCMSGEDVGSGPAPLTGKKRLNEGRCVRGRGSVGLHTAGQGRESPARHKGTCSAVISEPRLARAFGSAEGATPRPGARPRGRRRTRGTGRQ